MNAHQIDDAAVQRFLDTLATAGAFSDGVGLHGSMELVLERRDEQGNLIEIETRRKDNLIVNNGFDFISDAIGLSVSRPSVMNAIAVGTGVTAPAAADTTLQTELARKAATYAHTAGTKVFTFAVTFNAGEATGALTESGVLNNSVSVGILLDHVSFAVVNKGASDVLTVTFTFTMS